MFFITLIILLDENTKSVSADMQNEFSVCKMKQLLLSFVGLNTLTSETTVSNLKSFSVMDSQFIEEAI